MSGKQCEMDKGPEERGWKMATRKEWFVIEFQRAFLLLILTWALEE
jgi:hypothetical protein